MSTGRGEVGPPQRILFVEEITELIAESLPEFWKLGQAYVTGSLFHGMQMVTERQRQQQENCDKNREKFEVCIYFHTFSGLGFTIIVCGWSQADGVSNTHTEVHELLRQATGF